jgi:DTW domain-containing protein YfiP
MRANNRWLASDSIRCPGCRLHMDLCACALLLPMPTRTRVVLVTHVRELSKPTNTGRLALACIAGARLVERGRRGGGLASLSCEPDSQPLLLYPVPGAMPLDAWKAAQPAAADRVTLVVPDGTWRQTKRVRYRIPGLAHLPSVCLPAGLPSLFRLRHAGSAQRLATLEAIAHALRILDEPEIAERLMHIFQVVVDRSLWSNGRLSSTEVTGGIPAGASQDGPRNTAEQKLRAGRAPVVATKPASVFPAEGFD